MPVHCPGSDDASAIRLNAFDLGNRGMRVSLTIAGRLATDRQFPDTRVPGKDAVVVNCTASG